MCTDGLVGSSGTQAVANGTSNTWPPQRIQGLTILKLSSGMTKLLVGTIF